VNPLRISLLGAPRIDVDGQPLSVDTRKATAMLAYLAVTGHTHTRAVVANLLWPDADPDRSRAALRRTLSTLRTALGEGRLTSDRDSVGLDLADVWFDLAEFRSLMADPNASIPTLTAACDLHRDDLLAGFGLRDSVDFDDWQRLTQDSVRRERASALDRLIARLAEEGRFDEAVARAQQRLDLDRLHEPTHRKLIELYSAAGRRGDAFTQYRDCVRVLSRELGVQPLTETTELYRAISSGTELEPVIAEPVPQTDELPLVGRGAELRRIADTFGALSDDGAVVVIEGESGVGKTRLAEEAIRALTSRGAHVLTARPHAGERGLAYGVVAQLLRAAIGSEPDAVPEPLRGDAARLLPDLGPAPTTSLDEPGTRQHFLESISRLIADSFDDRPGVVFVDDLHWCDPASLDALGYLGRRLLQRRILLLGARRTDEPDPDQRGARLAELGQSIGLGRLTRDDVLGLAAQSGLDETAGREVYRESEGLPLLVSELLSAGGNSAGGVRAVLEARLAAVGETSAQVLGAAALIGRGFDSETLRVVSGRSEDEVASALEELTTRGLIIERDDAYDFGHERLRSIAEDRIGLARRRLLHRRIAEAFKTLHADPSIVAHHLERAGHDRQAAQEYAAAGDRARVLSAGTEAIAHYEAALALGHPDPEGLYEAIGDVGTLQGEYGPALAAYDAAAAQSESSAAGRIEHKLGIVHERRGDWQLAESHYLEALRLGADPAVVQSDRSRVAWRSGDADGARTLGFEALRRAEDTDALGPAAQANNILGLLGCGRGYLERSLELSTGLADPSIRIAALNNLALDHANEGELPQAEALLRQALELCTAQGDRHRQAALRNNLADVLHKAGRRDGAMEELKHAATAFAAIGSDGGELYPGVWNLVEW
jgi:DNA-binding SARP family transcriptional activator